jgi:type IV secretion system protein VirB4
MPGCLEDQDEATHRAALDVPLSRVVSLSSMVSKHDMRTRDGDYIRIIELKGLQFETAMPMTIEGWHNTLCNYIGTQSAQADCLFYIVRGQSFIRDRLDPVRDGGFATVFNELWSDRLDSLPALESRIYLVIVYRPPEMPKGFFRRSRTAEMHRQHQQRAMRVMDERSESALRALRHFQPRLLGTRRQGGARLLRAVRVRRVAGQRRPQPGAGEPGSAVPAAAAGAAVGPGRCGGAPRPAGHPRSGSVGHSGLRPRPR